MAMERSGISRLFLLKIAVKAIGRVLVKPLWLFAALLGFVASLTLLVWGQNLSILWEFVVLNLLPFDQSIRLLVSPLRVLGLYSGGTILALYVIFSIITGINFMLIGFLAWRSRRIPQIGTFGGSVGAASLSLGCAACGTTLVAPLLSVLGAGTLTLAASLGIVVTVLGILLGLYSAYKLGQLSATILAITD